jgi:hypothetical protein
LAYRARAVVRNHTQSSSVETGTARLAMFRDGSAFHDNPEKFLVFLTVTRNVTPLSTVGLTLVR